MNIYKIKVEYEINFKGKTPEEAIRRASNNNYFDTPSDTNFTVLDSKAIEPDRAIPEQLTISEIIAKLEKVENKNLLINMDLYSYRGSYDQLAINSLGKAVTIETAIAKLKSAIGDTFRGWKGGYNEMLEDTVCWDADDGECTQKAIIGIDVLNDTVVWKTKHIEGN